MVVVPKFCSDLLILGEGARNQQKRKNHLKGGCTGQLLASLVRME